MHPNRFPHLRLGAEGPQEGQAWHKDGYVFDHQLRTPRPRWLFALYCERLPAPPRIGEW